MWPSLEASKVRGKLDTAGRLRGSDPQHSKCVCVSWRDITLLTGVPPAANEEID